MPNLLRVGDDKAGVEYNHIWLVQLKPHFWPLVILTLAGKSHVAVPGVTSLKGAPNQLIIY